MLDSQNKGCIPDSIRAYLETKFYARINVQADFEHLLKDPDFTADPVNHVGFFSDHGVVHVRDVKQQLFQILNTINGVLIPARSHNRFDSFMVGYGEMISYLHDIGMVNFSEMGRSLHPEFAAQWVYTAEFDPLLDTIWDKNCGNLAWRLAKLASQGVLSQDPKLVLRELFAMSCCHSKSRVPIEVLNHPERLRSAMQMIISRELPFPDVRGSHQRITAFYGDIGRESFIWLTSTDAEIQALIEDVVDTLRALRCADALRQRGTVMKTSGNYEIFVDHTTGRGIIAVRKGESQLLLVEIPKSFSSGEANIASSELDKDGNLRVSFHRGLFTSAEIVDRAAEYAAMAVNDIQADVIGSFRRPKGDESQHRIKPANDILILLEGVDDNIDFSYLIRQKLLAMNPGLHQQVFAVPSLGLATPKERDRYLNADELDLSRAEKLSILENAAQSGHNIEGFDLEAGFRYCKVIELKAGDTLIEAGSQAGFVYIPLGKGLQIMPLGGYPPFSVNGWMPLGSTGVIRGAVRNATVVTNLDIRLLMIPKEVYLRYWHHPYTIEELLLKVNTLTVSG